MRLPALLLITQEDDSNTLHLIASFLLFDGRQNEVALRMLNEEGAFARLLELIQALRREDMDGGAGLHRLLMDLLYEMSRIQRMKIEDLGAFSTARVLRLETPRLVRQMADEYGFRAQFSWTIILFGVSSISSRDCLTTSAIHITTLSSGCW